MAVLGTLHKIVWGGTLAVTESWSCSVHVLSPEPTDIPFAPLDTALIAWMTVPNIVNSLAKYEWIKCNRIDPVTGKYVDQTNSRTFFTATAKAGGGGPTNPAVTAAITLRTGNLRGLAHVGRFFPPLGQNAAYGADGMLATANPPVLAGAAKTLLTAFLAAGGVPVVFSRKGQIALPVTSVACGRVVDHQGRRRRNLTENYVTVAM